MRRLTRWTRSLPWRRMAVVAAAGALLVGAGLAICWVVFPFPVDRLENQPQSRTITDRTGRPLLRLVGRDDQWRQPVRLDQISAWVPLATKAAEDGRFDQHPGVDVRAVGRAAWSNLTHGRVVSGASTLSMQVCRMMDPAERTLRAKAVEAFRALQLERCRTKRQILSHYLNMAPYGRNLRGIEAAARYYFNKKAVDLNLPESALLAGLPQSPENLRPDRHPARALKRRHFVLERMHRLNMIDLKTFAEADATPLRLRRSEPADRSAGQFAWMALAERPDGGRTTLDPAHQQAAAEAVGRHIRSLPEGADVAVVVLEIETGAVRALIGSADPADRRDGQVNGATARRSPGSTLKPFVYAAAYESNRLCGDSRLLDEPITLAGWSPQNFDRRFRGQVTADEALRLSLNVPAITVARQIGLERCAALMRAAGIDLAPHAERRGGLATVVGGSEVTLLHLTNAYATLGRGGYYRPVRFFEDQRFQPRPVLSKRTCAALNEALGSHHRTPHGLDVAPPWFMWKTGTSSRRRDAWAVGHNGRWAIGVWAGHFNGSSRGTYTGRLAAEPLLAALFSCKLFTSDRPAPKPVRWAVRSPLEIRTRSALKITHPTEGGTYRSLGGPFRLRPEVSGNPSQVQWFLNGRPIHPDRQIVRPGVGRHQLICRDREARLDTVQFVVR